MSSVAALPFSAWPTGRKVAAGVFAVGGYVALACAAVYLAGVLFLVLNKANPKQAQFASIVHYWDLYADDPQLRKKLQLAIGVSGIGLLILLPAGLVAAARPRRALHGDARFASPAEIDRAGLTGGDGQPGILIGRHRGKFLSLPGQLSVMLSAPTRSGKGVGVVIPNLLNWPDSVVVLDIKGENYDITAGYRAAHGQACLCLLSFRRRRAQPPLEPADRRSFQPAAPRRRPAHHRPGLLPQRRRRHVLRSLLQRPGAQPVPRPGPRPTRNPLASPHHRRDAAPVLGQGPVAEGSPERPDHAAPRGSGNKPALSDECTDALQRLLSNSENTLSSVVATFNAPLTIFADAVVDAATSADDFRLEDVRRRRMSVYVRIPPNRLANARPLLNLFFSQLVSLNTQHLPEQDPTLKVQCLLVNDEFTAMGRVGVITTAAAFLAGYNLRLLTVVQAMSQLDAVYGDKEARTFATNHGLQILYAPREQRDADEYSAMLGHFTERATSRGRSRSFSGHGSQHGQPQRERAAPRAAAAAGVQGTGQRAPGGDLRELQADPRREDPLLPRQGLHFAAAEGAGRAAHGHGPAPGARAAALALCRRRAGRQGRR
jgi:type IV secretion system protein VirD4